MATPVGDAIGLTGNDSVDGLVQGGQWQFEPEDQRVLTFAFEVENGLGVEWPEGLQEVVRLALGEWAAVADISFQEIPPTTDIDVSTANLAFAAVGNLLVDSGIPATALGIFPDPAGTITS